MTMDIDRVLDRIAIREATTLSFPTISRMQRCGQFPRFERISPGRVGLRVSVLAEFLTGRRDWGQNLSSMIQSE